jgi:hypothetical protein
MLVRTIVVVNNNLPLLAPARYNGGNAGGSICPAMPSTRERELPSAESDPPSVRRAATTSMI